MILLYLGKLAIILIGIILVLMGLLIHVAMKNYSSPTPFFGKALFIVIGSIGLIIICVGITL